MSEDADILELNPKLLFQVKWIVRRPNQPRATFTMQIPQDLALVQWLLTMMGEAHGAETTDREFEVPSDLLEKAIEKGLLVAPSDVADDAPKFACEVDPALLAFVPEDDLAALPAMRARASDLVLNPSRFIQRAGEPLLDERILLGQDLWKHLGFDFERRARIVEGAPTELGTVPSAGRLWVSHPVTEVMQPYDLTEVDGMVLSALAAGAIDPTALRQDLFDTFVLAHILVPRATEEDARQKQRQLEEARARLVEDKYVVIRNAVSPLQVAALRRHFRNLRRAGFLVTDTEQVVEKRDGIYCEFISVFLQHQLARLLNRIVPQPLKPSFTWFFRYRGGAELTRHTDRQQCRWNVSFAVDTDPYVARDAAWPLCFQVGDEVHSVRLGMGDAVLYSGSETPHWRDPLGHDQSAGMFFFHYVPVEYSGSVR